MNQVFNKLSWSVRALAQPAQIQKSLFPPFVVFADELALEFDEHYTNALPSISRHCNKAQASKLELLAKQIESMSGSDKPHIWLDDDCLDHEEWTVVRDLARDVIIEFVWSTESPPPCDAIYVDGHSKPE